MKRNWLIGVLVAAIILMGLWGVSERSARIQAQTSLMVSHQREFYNLLSETQGLKTVLLKTIASKSTGQKTMLLTTAWHRAWSAQDYLSALPIDIDASRTRQFLAQVGDYAYTVAQKTAKGRDISSNEEKKISELKNQVERVEDLLSKAESNLVRERFRSFLAGMTPAALLGPRGTWWGSLGERLLAFLNRPLTRAGEDRPAQKEGSSSDVAVQGGLSRPSPVSARDNFRELDEFLKATPLLVYDGPFSGHLENRRPLGIRGTPITADQARRVALRFVGSTDVPLANVAVTESKGVTPAYICSIGAPVTAPGPVTPPGTAVPPGAAPGRTPARTPVRRTATPAPAVKSPTPAVRGTAPYFPGGEAIVAVSKVGGKVLWSIDNRAAAPAPPATRTLIPGIAGALRVPSAVGTPPARTRPISAEAAYDKAKSFLSSKGFKNMEMTGSVVQEHILTASFVPKQDGVILYPDLVKVAVSLLNGQVVGFDASEYYGSHRTRLLPTPTLTTAEARRLVSPNLRVTSTRRALIPLPSRREVLTYEFRGKRGKDEYLVYINALNGDEEMILQVVRTPEGVMTK